MNRQLNFFIKTFCCITVLGTASAFAQQRFAPPPPALKPQNVTDLQKSLQRLSSAGNTATADNDLDSAKDVGLSPEQAALAPPDPDSDNAQQNQISPSSATNTQTQVNQGPPNPYEGAFNGVIDQLLPMTPEQVSRLRKAFAASKKAASSAIGVPPKPTSSSVQVDLAPQATPPVIRLEGGYITSMVFMDSTGQPWPIASYSIGNPGAYNIQWDKKGNTMLIQALSYYKQTNLAVILKGLNTPVMLTLIPGQTAVDYRVDLRVPGLGPNATFTSSDMLPNSANPVLLNVLNSIPPNGSKALKVHGCSDCQAWVVGKTMYMRTSLDIISPAWRSIMSSMDGTHAYELTPSPVVLATQHGKDQTITLRLEGWE